MNTLPISKIDRSYVTGAVFDQTTNLLTFTKTDGSTVVADLTPTAYFPPKVTVTVDNPSAVGSSFVAHVSVQLDVRNSNSLALLVYNIDNGVNVPVVIPAGSTNLNIDVTVAAPNDTNVHTLLFIATDSTGTTSSSSANDNNPAAVVFSKALGFTLMCNGSTTPRLIGGAAYYFTILNPPTPIGSQLYMKMDAGEDIPVTLNTTNGFTYQIPSPIGVEVHTFQVRWDSGKYSSKCTVTILPTGNVLSINTQTSALTIVPGQLCHLQVSNSKYNDVVFNIAGVEYYAEPLANDLDYYTPLFNSGVPGTYTVLALVGHLQTNPVSVTVVAPPFYIFVDGATDIVGKVGVTNTLSGSMPNNTHPILNIFKRVKDPNTGLVISESSTQIDQGVVAIGSNWNTSFTPDQENCSYYMSLSDAVSGNNLTNVIRVVS